MSLKYYIGGIVLFSLIYDIFSFLSLEKNMYIGIFSNIFCSSLCCVVMWHTFSKYFQNHYNKFQYLPILFLCSGNVILFSTTHLRDGWVLLLVTIVFSRSLKVYLEKVSIFFIIKLGAFTFLTTVLFVFLRGEFFLVPSFIIGSAIICKAWIKKEYNLLFLISIVFISLLSLFINDILQVVQQGYSYYQALSAGREDVGESLGYRLIINQPLLIRIPLGLFYLAFYPIPLFGGKPLEESYDLFKMLNGIYNIFVIPGFIVAVLKLTSFVNFERFSILLSILIVVTLAIMIAITSLESRHFAVFLFPLLLPIFLQSWNEISSKRLYVQILIIVIILLFSIHILWAQLKLF